MRDALNSNPVVQIAVIGVLIAVVGLFFMMNMKKSQSGAASETSDASALSTSGAGTAATTTPTVIDGAPSTGATGSAGIAVPGTGTVTPEALVPGPGLPAEVVSAWKSGDAVVLLVVRGGGIDDRLVRGSVAELSGDSRIAVFVARAKSVARYSRITQGVGVDRAPALVVVRPRKESGSVPQAEVRYGFRNSQSVVQAVRDAVYSGRDNLPYSPR